MYKASLSLCMAILGANHSHTGDVYLDLGSLTDKMDLKDEALKYYEKAYAVFETTKGKKAIECGQTSHHMARLLLTSGQIKDSLRNAQRATEIYESHGDKFVENILECYILIC
mmetsp:Transcript_40131/g.35734  ORF Transcript_40131/g.35734 Transcript_40131/m.35734 type:complete len:113 (-) Transcript_40131:35-373(-)